MLISLRFHDVATFGIHDALRDVWQQHSMSIATIKIGFDMIKMGPDIGLLYTTQTRPSQSRSGTKHEADFPCHIRAIYLFVFGLASILDVTA